MRVLILFVAAHSAAERDRAQLLPPKGFCPSLTAPDAHWLADLSHDGGGYRRTSPRGFVQHADAADEVAAVCNIDVVNARSDAGFGNGVVHCLKRTGGVHD